MSRARAALLASCGAGALSLLHGCAPAAGETVETAGPPVSFEGITLSEFAGSTLRRRLAADQFLIIPKHIGLFRIGPLREMVITHARLEVLADERSTAARSYGGLFPRGALDLLGAAQLPTSASMYDAEMDLIHAGEAPVRLAAARANVDPEGDVSLRDFDVLLPDGQRIRGPRALWRVEAGDLLVAGSYELLAKGSVTKGRGLRVALRGARPAER